MQTTIPNTIKNTFRNARNKGVPLIAIETTDPAATINACVAGLNGEAESVSILGWDAIRTLRGLNTKGLNTVGAMCEGQSPREKAGDPASLLGLLPNLPDGGVIFFFGAPMFIQNEYVRQGVWNLRDDYKARHCTLILLGDAFKLPSELTNDILILADPLPTFDALKAIGKSVIEDANNSGAKIKLDNALLEKVADIMTGMSAFAAEQQLALSLDKTSVRLDVLWDRKVKVVQQTPGLTVWRGGNKFEDIGGLDNLQTFLTSLLRGKKAPKVIAFVDEIEKGFAAAGTDTSGVTQDQNSCLLRYMQDNRTPGIILLGPPGVGKSEIAKASGNEIDIPTVAVDLGGMKGSLVGQSEQQMRRALDVIESIGQGKVLWIATCNSIGVLPPELRRRFYIGTFFCDLPTAEERKSIWSLYQKKFSLESQAIPDDANWTGAEIFACCDKADRLGWTLRKAATTVVPVAVSAAKQIENLRQSASGCYVSASYEGVYNYQPDAAKEKSVAADGSRKMKF